jgi:hypothetical protein
MMDLEDLDYVLGSLKLLGSKGTTGTQASFLELFDGAGEKYNFLCSGGTSTKQFKKIAERERAKLLEDLFEKSEQLHKHHITALTKKRWGEDPEEETGET